MTDTPVSPSWWKDYFSAHYGTLYRGILAPELSTEEEIAALRRILPRGGGPLLDIGCGHGRHLEVLRGDGWPLLGLDYSADLLRLLPPALRHAAVRGDMRRLPFRPASLAGACMIFNTFGYFDDETNAGVLRGVAGALRPGAPLVLDLPARAGMKDAVRSLPLNQRHHDGISIVEAWGLDEEGRRIVSRGTWEIGGTAQEWEMALRLHTPVEMERMLRRAGFSGPIEIRPMEDIAALGTSAPAPPLTRGPWRSATNMAVLARR